MVVIKAVADIECAEFSLALTTFIAGVRRIVHAEATENALPVRSPNFSNRIFKSKTS